MSLLVFLFVAQQLAVSISIGGATFALIFYYKSMRDGHIDAEERSFMRVVYLVMRIGLSAIIITELLLVADFYSGGGIQLLLTSAFWFRWMLLGVIVINAIMMDMRKMPHGIGPAITGASWYMYAVVTILSRANFGVPFFVWILWYVLFVCVFAGFLMLVDTLYIRKKRVE